MPNVDELFAIRKSLDEICRVPDKIISVYTLEQHIWADTNETANEAARAQRIPAQQTGSHNNSIAALRWASNSHQTCHHRRWHGAADFDKSRPIQASHSIPKRAPETRRFQTRRRE